MVPLVWDYSGLSSSLTNIFSFKTVGKIVLEIPTATSEMLSSYYPIISQLEGQHISDSIHIFRQ